MLLKSFLYSILMIFLLYVFASVTTATTQEKDLIIYEGSRYYTYVLPSLSEALPNIELPNFIMLSTANWDGYRASWAIIENQLFLIGVEGKTKENSGKRMLSSRELFPELIFPVKIVGFSGIIKLNGRMMDYEIVENDKVETTEINLQFKNGIVEKVSRITINKDKINRDKGKALFESSAFKKSFEEHFTTSNIEAGEGKIFGVYFEDPEWRADFIPKKKHLDLCFAEAVFPIINDKKIDVSITPQDIITTLEKCLIHPFVSKRFDSGGATGIRIRITGDRLHWNTPELQRIHKKLKGVEIDKNEIRSWAYIIIDAVNPRFTSFYFNSKNGDLLLND